MIGQTVYFFDINRRRYRHDEKGRAFGSPIWREHWAPVEIVGETSRSWVGSWGEKIPKKGADPRVWAFSQEEIDRRAWVEDNCMRIAEEVRRLGYGDLRKVEAIVKAAND